LEPFPRRALLTRAGRGQYGEILASREKYEALDARATALGGLLQGTRALALQTSLPGLVAAAQRLAAGVVRCDAASVLVHDAANDALFTFIPDSNGSNGAGSRRVSVPASDVSVAGACFAAGEALRVPDVYADPRFARQRAALARGDAAAPGPCAMLCVPVRRENGSKGAAPVLAVVQLVRDSAQGSEPFEPFSPVDAQRVQDFAQACPALGALPFPSLPLPSRRPRGGPAAHAAGPRRSQMVALPALCAMEAHRPAYRTLSLVDDLSALSAQVSRCPWSHSQSSPRAPRHRRAPPPPRAHRAADARGRRYGTAERCWRR